MVHRARLEMGYGRLSDQKKICLRNKEKMDKEKLQLNYLQIMKVFMNFQ